MRTPRLLATAALAAALVTAPLTVSAASAATPPRYNVLAGFCEGHRHVSCVAEADDDSGLLVIRDHAGHPHHLFGERAVLAYLDRHATPCAHEDSTSCVWDAAHRGNHRGDSFLVVGKHSFFSVGDFS